MKIADFLTSAKVAAFGPQPRKIDLSTHEEYLAFSRQKKISDYEHATVKKEIDHGISASSKIMTEKVRTQFFSDIHSLVDYKIKTNEKYAKQFKQWLEMKDAAGTKNINVAFNDFTIERMAQEDKSLGEVVETLYQGFVSGMDNAQSSRTALQKLIRRTGLPQASAWLKQNSMGRVGIKTIAWVGSGLTFMLAIGPGQQLTNAVTGFQIQPVVQWLEKLSVQRLGWINQSLNDMIINYETHKRSRAEQLEMESKIEKAIEVVRNNSNISESEKRKKLEQSFIAMNLGYQRNLQANMREGRSFAKDSLMGIITIYGTNMGVTLNEFRHARDKIRELDYKLIHDQDFLRKNPGVKANLNEQIAGYRKEMEVAEQKLAFAAASWRLYKLMYGEFKSLPNATEQEREAAKHLEIFNYETFEEGMRFDSYATTLEKVSHDFFAQVRKDNEFLDKKYAEYQDLARKGDLKN